MSATAALAELLPLLPHRITRKLEPDPDDWCLLWTGWLDGDGYGMVNIDGDMRRIHRIVWQARYCELDPDCQLNHWCHLIGLADGTCQPGRCDHRRCVIHTEPMTLAENVAAGMYLRPTCKRGHPWTAESIYLHPTGQRRCRICHRDSERDHRAKTAAAKRPVRRSASGGSSADPTAAPALALPQIAAHNGGEQTPAAGIVLTDNHTGP